MNRGERLAARHYRLRGYRILGANVRAGGYEVDIADGEPVRADGVVLATPALHRIPDAIALARRTRRIVRQNLAWAIGWNLVALPIAAMGLVTPWIAALGMALSSLTVTLNALRLARVREGVAA